MKKCLLFLLLCFNISFSQTVDIDATIKKIAKEKNEDKKVDLITSFYRSAINNDPQFAIQIGLKLLKQSQADKIIIEEASAYSMLGQGYRLLGNNIKALQYHHKAIATAEKSGNFSILAIAENQTANVYKDREEYDKAATFYLSALRHSQKGKSEFVKSWPLSNLGTVYLAQNKLDSALVYSQRAFEIILKQKDRPGYTLVYINLAGVNSKLGNAPLAVSYYRMAIKEFQKEGQGQAFKRYSNLVYNGLSEHYKRVNQLDSSAFYAKKAISVVKNSKFFYLSSKPAILLSELYEKTNCDSTLKYSKIYKTATDSLVSSKTNQQIQLMTFEEDLRQQELAQEKIKLGEQNKENLQYIFIGIGILTLIILFLLLSRSFITNTKLIQFFGIVGLLIVFEFLNLLLHPFLEKVTHHSPILMLLGLVAIAALLVPLHHKVEHWATSKLIEKNKQIRLEKARKTIEKLEKPEDEQG